MLHSNVAFNCQGTKSQSIVLLERRRYVAALIDFEKGGNPGVSAALYANVQHFIRSIPPGHCISHDKVLGTLWRRRDVGNLIDMSADNNNVISKKTHTKRTSVNGCMSARKPVRSPSWMIKAYMRQREKAKRNYQFLQKIFIKSISKN